MGKARINDSDLSKGYGQARMPGQTYQKACNCVGVDDQKKPVAVACDHEKLSSARKEGHGAQDSALSPADPQLGVARNAQVMDGELENETHRADMNDPVYLE